MRLMKKNIFSLFLFLNTTSIYGSNVTETFIIDSEDNNQSFVSMKANAYANKLILHHAYLSIIDDDRYQDCWLEFLKNKEIKINVSESKLNPVSANKNSVYYELRFNTDKIIVPENVRQNLIKILF